MAKKAADAPPKESPAFANNPFAKLAQAPGLAAKAASSAVKPTVVPSPPRAHSAPAPRISMRHEAVGRSGKVATRISGVPVELLAAVAAALGKGLGCIADLDGQDVILAGSLKERAGEWLHRFGDLRKLTEQKVAAPARPAQDLASPSPPPPPGIASNASGTYRKNIRPGTRVAIVMKEDQPSGELTTGVVRDLLTRSDDHPRGIKVRLVSGQIGRVKIIYV